VTSFVVLLELVLGAVATAVWVVEQIDDESMVIVYVKMVRGEGALNMMGSVPGLVLGLVHEL